VAQVQTDIEWRWTKKNQTPSSTSKDLIWPLPNMLKFFEIPTILERRLFGSGKGGVGKDK
jgi:hypothetical protein